MSDVFRDTEFVVTRKALEAGGRVRGIRVPGGAALSRKQVDEVEAAAKGAGALGLLRIKRVNGVLDGPAAKFLGEGAAARLGLRGGRARRCTSPAPTAISSPALDRVRQEVAQRMQLVPAGVNAFVWVTDFPMFERDPATGALGGRASPIHGAEPGGPRAARRPSRGRRARRRTTSCSTAPSSAAAASASTILACSRASSGCSASTRRRRRARFGFLLEALRAGAPPHGGIAFGFDRITMVLAGATSLRDVIAFPKTTAARALFEGAPSRCRRRTSRSCTSRVEPETGVSESSITQKLSTEGADMLTLAGVNDGNLVELSRARRGEGRAARRHDVDLGPGRSW